MRNRTETMFWWLIYPTFGLLKMHNMSKMWFANNKFSCKDAWFTINRLSKILFLPFHFSNFQITIVKNHPFLWWISKVLMKFYYVTNIFDLHFFWQWNSGPFNCFLNFHGNIFCFFIISKWKKYYNLTFDDTFKMYSCTLC